MLEDMAREVKRVLVYRLGSMGDTIVALPALHLIERVFPDAERRLLTNFPVSDKAAAAAGVLGSSGLIGGYFHYPVGTRDPLSLVRLWWRLVRWRPQLLVYLGGARGVESARRDALFFRICGIRRQIGVPVTEAMQETQWKPELEAHEYECERLARNIAELGDAHLETREAWDMRLNEAERAKADEVLTPAGNRPILGLSLGTKIPVNHWGQENWRALLARLGSLYPEYALAITGVASESEVSEYAAAGWRETAGRDAVVLNLCGRLSPRESAACFARAKLFLGHDSGPMHFAASVGTRVVAVFSARNLQRVWFPYGKGHRVIYHAVNCMGCGLQTCTIEKTKCVTSISVDEVLAQVRAELDG